MRRLLTACSITAVVLFGSSFGLLAQKAPKGATARCKDGSYSSAKTERGACSGHGGVAKWIDESKAPEKSPRAPKELRETASRRLFGPQGCESLVQVKDRGR